MLLWKCDSYFAILFKTKCAIVWRAGKKRLVWRGEREGTGVSRVRGHVVEQA